MGFSICPFIIPLFQTVVKNIIEARCLPHVPYVSPGDRIPSPGTALLLLAEGLAVGTLIHGGVHLMGAHQNLVQGAVVLTLAVVGTLLDRTLDALVGMAVHIDILLCIGFADSMVRMVAIYTFL